MRLLSACSIITVLTLTAFSAVAAQDDVTSEPANSETSSENRGEESSPANNDREPDVTGKARELAEETQAKVEKIAEKVDQNETAKKAAEGILGPIYLLAESLSFSAFHWLAFGLMTTGVVSFAMQLVLGKLALLLRGSLNFREILSDAIGLVISALGLVLTTQAAAENSEFTHSPAAVLSATGVGIVLGFILYRWGHDQEVNALTGQRATPAPAKK